jgi:uncharacterized membrane protein
MGSVTTHTTIDADVSSVFDFVSDYRTAVGYSRDLKKWEPVTEVTDEVGAQFDAVLQLGPKGFESRVEIDSRTEPETFGWSSISGFVHSGRYTFTPTDDGARTEVRFEFDYTMPGGLAGRLLAKTTEPLLKASLASNLATLKKQVEERSRAAG